MRPCPQLVKPSTAIPAHGDISGEDCRVLQTERRHELGPGHEYLLESRDMQESLILIDRLERESKTERKDLEHPWWHS